MKAASDRHMCLYESKTKIGWGCLFFFETPFGGALFFKPEATPLFSLPGTTTGRTTTHMLLHAARGGELNDCGLGTQPPRKGGGGGGRRRRRRRRRREEEEDME